MAQSVPEIDVLQAADRVLARGERPTVERVRAELGRGSPARVGQFLDQWWEALAKRLAGETRLPELPADVAAAFKTVWTIASEHATTIAHQHQVAAQAALDQEKQAIVAERTQWAAEREASASAMAAAAEARTAAEQRLVDLQRLIEQVRTERDDVVAQRNKSFERADRLERDFVQLGAKLDKQVTAIAAERQSMANHVRSIEDRAHAEIDRAREDAKAVRHRLKDVERESVVAARAAAERLAKSEKAAQEAVRAWTVHEATARTLEQQLARLTASPGVRQPKAKVTRARKPATRLAKRGRK